jgi:hypothetical protein
MIKMTNKQDNDNESYINQLEHMVNILKAQLNDARMPDYADEPMLTKHEMYDRIQVLLAERDKLEKDLVSLVSSYSDSWDKVDADLEKGACAYFSHSGKDCHGCPAYCTEKCSCEGYMARDLVRRCKELAGVTDDSPCSSKN